MPKEITAFSNPLVKQARGLREKKQRRAEGLFLAEGLRILTEAREAGVLPERIFFADGSHRLVRALVEAVESAGRRGRRDQRGHPPQDQRQGQSAGGARHLPPVRHGPLGDRPEQLAALDRGAGAARSRQSRHDPQDRRRGRRGRADPDRRLRRPLLGRGGARLDGRPVHAEARGGALGRVPRLAARRPRSAGRDQP